MSIFKSNKKQHSIFFSFIFSLLFIAVLFFVALPAKVNAQSTSTLPSPFYDNFDSYTVGDILGQGIWTSGNGMTYFVRSDEHFFLSYANALSSEVQGTIFASSSVAIDNGSTFFSISVLEMESFNTVRISFLEDITALPIFHLGIEKIDNGHFCVQIYGSCLYSVALATSTIETANWYKVGITWDRIRQKIKLFDNSGWSSEYDPNAENIWTYGINRLSINNTVYPMTFYIDNITDNTYFEPPAITPPPENSAILKQQAYDGCESWGLASPLCKALVYLFLPDDFYLQKFGDLFDVVKSKPPFGYYYSTKDAIATLNASSTPAFSFPDLGSIKTDFFDKIRTGLAWILWVMFAFFTIKRIGDFVP